MIPALIIWLFKKYVSGRGAPRAKVRSASAKTLLLLFLPVGVYAAGENVSVYRIKHKGSVIGQLNLKQRDTGDNLYLLLESEVKTHFVFGIEVKTYDQAHFRKGTLVTSQVSRTVNGREKESRKTALKQNFYQTLAGKDTGRLERPIHYNMMMLYLREPVNVTEVYSDNYLKFLPIRKTATQTYRVDLPDGNFNEYHFQNGVCRLVTIRHSMYTIQMELI